ncbi:MAG: ABC transporter permease [bacterium]
MAEFVQQQWAALFPTRPYDGFFLETTLAEQLQVTRSIEQIFYYIAIISVMIAAMGLFALVSLNIAKRTKEIGVRKILGASVARLGQLISKEFVLLLSLGFVLALPFGYACTEMLMSSIYAYHVGFNLAPFLQAGALMFLVAFVTVGLQVYRAATTNPALALRDE